MIAYYAPAGSFSWMIAAHQTIHPWIVFARKYAAIVISMVMSAVGLGAIYVLICFLNTAYQEDELHSSQRSTVMEFLSDHPDASTEELSLCAFLLAMVPQPRNQRTQEQLGAAINLLVSFALWLCVVLVLATISCICHPRRHDVENDMNEEKRCSRGFRLLKIGLLLRRYTLKLKEDDQPDKNPSPVGKADEIGDPDKSCWMLPFPGVPRDGDCHLRKRRCISERCAICLDDYSKGDKVVWSSNPDCIHAYHERCILSWMLPMASINQQCPCCRQTFLSMKDSPEVCKKVY